LTSRSPRAVDLDWAVLKPHSVAVTLDAADAVPGTSSPPVDPAVAIKQYRDSETGVSVLVPADWVVTGIVPGQRATLQSYDTKCDLSIRPPDISAVDYVQQTKSNSAITTVSEDEIIPQSGKPGTRIELESMGRSLLLITEIDERVVVLTCFGELAPFDQIAVTLGAADI